MERVFYNLHSKVSLFALRHTSHRARSLVEHCALTAAVCGFCVVLLAHRTFVYRGAGALTSVGRTVYTGAGAGRSRSVPALCLRSVPGFNPHAHVTHVLLDHHHQPGIHENDDEITQTQTGSYAYTLGPSQITCALTQHRQQRHSHYDQHHSLSPNTHTNSHTHTNTQTHTNSHTCQQHSYPHLDHPFNKHKSSLHTCLPSSDASFHSTMHHNSDEHHKHVLFSYSLTKGFLLLTPATRTRHNITSQYVVVATTDTNCFGEAFLQGIVFNIIGPDTVIMNWLLALHDGTGYLYNHRSTDLIDLHHFSSDFYFLLPRPTEGTMRKDRDDAGDNHHRHHGRDDDNDIIIHKAFKQETPTKPKPHNNYNYNDIIRGRWYYKFIVFKLGVILASVFLFFITTTLVSFTLRETQDRMLEFTFQLRAYVRAGLPRGQLIFAHVIENLVFVPIMVGMMFFLIEFYGGDKFLAFMVLSVVWVCESFSVISMRSIEGMQFFPRVFFLYFTLFHVYFFSCPFGFTYTSLASTLCFMAHAMLFFWNRYELPAVLSGLVTQDSPRMGGVSRGRTSPIQSLVPNTEVAVSSPNHATRRITQSPSYGNSFPSTSSLGRSSLSSSHGFVDDGDDSYMFYMNGEVVMRRDHYVATPLPMSQTLDHRDGTSERRRPNHLSSSVVQAATEAAAGTLPETVSQPLADQFEDTSAAEANGDWSMENIGNDTEPSQSSPHPNSGSFERGNLSVPVLGNVSFRCMNLRASRSTYNSGGDDTHVHQA